VTTFKGAGPGKGTWTKRRYGADGTVTDGERAPARSTPAVHTRFVPFVSHQVAAADAKALGLPRTKSKGTCFSTERQLREYMALEKRNGREKTWKE
jgi:hypothetical protein